MYARGVVIFLLGILTACGGSASSPAPSTSEVAQSVPASAAPTGTAEPTASQSGVAGLAIDTLARVAVSDLSLRARPSLRAEQLGILPSGEPAYVVAGPVEADGYAWYQLASVRQPYTGSCGDPAPAPSLACADWFGWAAAVTADGDRWLIPMDPECPAERDTQAYLPLLPALRLACAGDDEWRLTVYLAPETEGRGCYPVWVTTPYWLGGCNLLFPQPVESQFDSDERIHPSVHPDLGTCGLGTEPDCPFDALKGSWVEMIGHLDDPAASTCRSELGPAVGEGEEAPYPPPDPEQVVFACRLALVVTEVQATSAPSG